jgi:CubicO group peptidase (beta-lactamase class C family)
VSGRLTALLALSALLSLPATSQQPLTAEAMTAFLDSTFRDIRYRHGVPGIAVAVVQGGAVLVERAYGFSDLQKRRPMSTRDIRFPVGSLSKTVTAAAVLRAVGQGKLRLSDPLAAAAPELDLDLYGDEITLEHLLTHTAGFETWNIGLAAVSADAVIPYQTFLRQALPRRIARAGKEFIYSQQSIAAAALMLERAVGVPFEDYVRDTMLIPLGMTNSSIHARGLAHPEMVQSYVTDGDALIAAPTIFAHFTPAGGLAATTHDLATLANALLGHAPAVIPAAVIREMGALRFHADSLLPGTGIGLYEYRLNDRSGRAHGGWYGGTSSFLYLLPESDFGIVLAANSDNGDAWRQGVLEELHDRWFPRTRPAIPMPESFAAGVRPEMYPGIYRRRRFAGAGLERLGNFFFAELVRVDPAPAGDLLIRRDAGNLRAVGVSPTSFRVEWRGDNDYVSFDAGNTTPPTRLLINLDTYDRVPGWQARPLLFYLVGGIVALAPLAFLGVLVLLVRGPSGTRISSTMLACALAALTLVAAGFAKLFAEDPVAAFALGIPPIVRMLAWITVAGGVCWVAFGVLELRASRRRRKWGRVTAGSAGTVGALVLALYLFLGILSSSALTSPVSPRRAADPRVPYPTAKNEASG